MGQSSRQRAYYSGIEHVPYDRERAINFLKEAGYTIPLPG
jgi:hypothetical protein